MIPTKPTPIRRADPRLSNCVLEGGRQKNYAPPPPPPPDTDFHSDISFSTDIGEGIGYWWGMLIFALMVALVFTIVVMITMGCSPSWCPP